MMTRLRQQMAPRTAWSTILGALLVPFLIGAWMRFDSSKVDTLRFTLHADSVNARFVADSQSAAHARANLSRDISDLRGLILRVDSTTHRIESRMPR